MPGGLNVITQDDFSAGEFQAPDTQRIPANGAYQIVNGLLDLDAGVVYRRGGGSYLGAGSDAPFGGRIWSMVLAGGQRTMWSALGSGAAGLNVLADDDLSATTMLSGVAVDVEPGVGKGIAWFPVGSTVYGYAGYRGGAGPYSTGTVAVTQGSRVVTGTGTTWASGGVATNVQPGFLLSLPVTGRVQAVESVDSATQVTLASPWDGATQSGVTYSAGPSLSVAVSNFAGRTTTTYATAVGGRLVLGNGSQVIFVDIDATPTLSLGPTTNLHQLPNGAQLRGLASVRDTVLVFTDKGIYTINNIALDLTDASGNPQQRLDLLSAEVLLKGHHGIASWKNALVVPAADDVYLIDGASSPVPISQPIRTKYRAIKGTAILGQAAIFNGHYVLPYGQYVKLSITPFTMTLVPLGILVCNLENGTWTEITGSGSGTDSGVCLGFARRNTVVQGNVSVVASTTTRILGVNHASLFDCSGWWSPTAANKNDADGSTHTFSLTTRDYSTSNRSALFKKLRLWAEGIDAGSDSPTLSAGFAEGLAGTTFTPLAGTAGASAGDTPAGVWAVNSGGRRVRFQITSSSPWASLKIKAIDIFVRPKGRA